MKFSLAWLKQYLETGASAQEIAAKLNALGIEVEGLEDPAERLAGFKVAKVLTSAPHPNADKLQVLSIDDGSGAPLQVVCGAPNARAGLVGVLGLPGAVVTWVAVSVDIIDLVPDLDIWVEDPATNNVAWLTTTVAGSIVSENPYRS